MMLRIDADRFTILFIEFRDHLHRYAAQSDCTCTVAARRFIDDINPALDRKEISGIFTLMHNEVTLPPWETIGSRLRDGHRVTVVAWKEEG